MIHVWVENLMRNINRIQLPDRNITPAAPTLTETERMFAFNENDGAVWRLLNETPEWEWGMLKELVYHKCMFMYVNVCFQQTG